MNLSKHLKSWRKSKGMSQDELAEELNISRSCVSKIESGKKQPDINTFVNWAKATNCDMQAAIVLFGSDVITNAANLISTLPMIIKLWRF